MNVVTRLQPQREAERKRNRNRNRNRKIYRNRREREGGREGGSVPHEYPSVSEGSSLQDVYGIESG